MNRAAAACSDLHSRPHWLKSESGDKSWFFIWSWRRHVQLFSISRQKDSVHTDNRHISEAISSQCWTESSFPGKLSQTFIVLFTKPRLKKVKFTLMKWKTLPFHFLSITFCMNLLETFIISFWFVFRMIQKLFRITFWLGNLTLRRDLNEFGFYVVKVLLNVVGLNFGWYFLHQLVWTIHKESHHHTLTFTLTSNWGALNSLSCLRKTVLRKNLDQSHRRSAGTESTNRRRRRRWDRGWDEGLTDTDLTELNVQRARTPSLQRDAVSHLTAGGGRGLKNRRRGGRDRTLLRLELLKRSNLIWDSWTAGGQT